MATHSYDPEKCRRTVTLSAPKRLDAQQRALAQAMKAFGQDPSAFNYRTLEAAMQAYQSACYPVARAGEPQCPETVNGLPVLRYHYTPKAPATRDGWIILVQKGEDEWVTAWLGVNEETGKADRSWLSGHYFSIFGNAADDFDARVARGH